MHTPSVIFIIADQHRWDFMGYEHNGVTLTPNLDNLARSGAVFHSAYCNAPLCGPSRQSLASGRYGMNTGCYTNLHELAPGAPTFVNQFRQNGYRTCAIGKTHMEIHAYDSDLRSYRHREFMQSLGWDETTEVSGNGLLSTGIRCAYSEWLREQGRLAEVAKFYAHWNYAGLKRPDPLHEFQPLEWPLPEEFQETAFIGNRAVEWIKAHDRSKPFFLHVGFAGPHMPIEPPPQYLEAYRRIEEPPAWGAADLPPWLPDARRGYRAMISQIDSHVGKIREALAAQGALENTIFVYTADHGEMAGDHGKFGKEVFFEGSMRVPLIVAGPGVKPGIDSRALVELIDLGRTLNEVCRVPAHKLDQGMSLQPILSGAATAHRDTIYGEMSCDRMIFDGRFKLFWGDSSRDTRSFGGPKHTHRPAYAAPSPARLYDLQADPHELQDLVSDPAYAALMKTMLEKLLIRINENVQMAEFKSRGQVRPILG